MASNQGNQGNNNQGNQGSGSGRGFAGMDPERQREIAAEGGRAAHASGNAHEFSSEEARRAGSMSHGGGNQNSGNQGGGNQGSGGSTQSNANSGGTRGGSSQQHAEAGRQSHKNDR
ncbi:KGG domain-containing protein [Paracidovorax konjaci]|uniref:Stress-induced acidophilic repeat motif-containing protein n=1 Tax=Paracidovorax konjaci TaxID=32040 RepID=A0A1I1TBB8_9BURK|nr:KGG domain-containing protein [Paracidovorax konjaci]SFD55889.1 Stress-induced acidophilic repeat motif-containing protein [Paracidovorax konjaci]